MNHLNDISVSNRDADAEWCQDMNCSTMVGKMICPNTCKEAGKWNICIYQVYIKKYPSENAYIDSTFIIQIN